MKTSDIVKLADNFLKLSFIKKIKGKYVVLSEKGRNLGSYNTMEEAEKRLKQINFFKYRFRYKFKKKAETVVDLKDADSVSLSGIMRLLRKRCTPKQVLYFLKKYHEYFLECMMKKEDYLEQKILEKTIKSLDEFAIDDIVSNSRELNDDRLNSLMNDYHAKSLAPLLPPYPESYDVEQQITDEESKKPINQYFSGSNNFPNVGVYNNGVAPLGGLGPTEDLRGFLD